MKTVEHMYSRCHFLQRFVDENKEKINWSMFRPPEGTSKRGNKQIAEIYITVEERRWKKTHIITYNLTRILSEYRVQGDFCIEIPQIVVFFSFGDEKRRRR